MMGGTLDSILVLVSSLLIVSGTFFLLLERLA